MIIDPDSLRPYISAMDSSNDRAMAAIHTKFDLYTSEQMSNAIESAIFAAIDNERCIRLRKRLLDNDLNKWKYKTISLLDVK